MRLEAIATRLHAIATIAMRLEAIFLQNGVEAYIFVDVSISEFRYHFVD